MFIVVLIDCCILAYWHKMTNPKACHLFLNKFIDCCIHSLIHSSDAIEITMIRSRASIFYGCISGKFDDDNQKVIFHSILSISLRNSMRFIVSMHHFHRFIHKWVRETLRRYNGFLFELNENLLDIFIWIKTSYALHTYSCAHTHARLHMFPYPISGT